MIKLATLPVFLFFSMIATYSYACDSDVMLNSQSELDNYTSSNPGCSQILGNVHLSGDIDDLSGLSSINSISGGLVLQNLPNLENLTGLENIQSIGLELYIIDCDALDNLAGLYALQTIGDELRIHDNEEMTSLIGMPQLSSIASAIDVNSNPNLQSLNGLQSITNVNQYVNLINNFSLESLEGLNNLTTITGDLYIEGNTELQDFSGLEELTSIGSNLEIWYNYNLLNFEGLNNLQSIDGLFRIIGNTNLEALSGLDNLESINGILHIQENITLSSLIGIQNLDPYSIQDSGSSAGLSIEGNWELSLCSVEPVCTYVTIPDRTASIQYNHETEAGCNMISEIETGCASVGIPGRLNSTIMTMYPNPANDMITVDFSDMTFDEVSITITDTYGKIIVSINSNNLGLEVLDVSELTNGLYMLEIRTESGVQRNQQFSIAR